MTQYIALLRGINVGGNNLIKMTDLKVCFEDMGFKNVQTVIASGNVLFATKKTSTKTLENKIEKTLSKKFNYDSRVVVVSHTKLTKIMKDAPRGFGTKPKQYHSDVAFLKDVTSTKALKAFEPNPEVDKVWKGPGVIYHQRLSEKLSKSRLSKVTGKPVYKNMTIRSWNTTTKLLNILDNRA